MNSLSQTNLTTNQQALDFPEELHHSAAKILTYAGVSKEKADLFMSNLEAFMNLKDKSSADANNRQICEQLALVFYECYPAVLKQVLAENNQDRLYKMFLCFGYMDERLLSPQQCNTLYQLLDQPAETSNFSIRYLHSWLESISKCEQEPSINEFGQDYHDLFLVKKKRGELSDKDKAAYDADCDARLQHELENLFKLGQRLCYGQIGSHCPILHQEILPRDLDAALVTPAKLEASLNRVLAIDFSVFHREIVFSHNSHKFAPELIMKPVLPELILMPGYGCRAVMWQVLSGKSKSTPGRFIFPIFTDENLDNLVIDVLAKFRWDLSKNMSGSFINKANEISLYMDYSDYIQFYAKNRDLSGDAKERLKTAVKRHRNNAREIFTLDYHTWINYESRSLLRLNKVAREILFKHCPFSKEVRNDLASSPIYSPIIENFNRTRTKQCKVLQSRYAKLVTPNKPLDPSLLDNLSFYNG